MSSLLTKSVGLMLAMGFYSCTDSSSVEPDLTAQGTCRIVEMSYGTTKLIFQYNDESKIDSLVTYDGDELVYYSFLDYINDYTVDIYHSGTDLLDGSLIPHNLPERLEFDVQGRLLKYSFIENEVGWPPTEVAPYIHDFDTLIYDESGKLIDVQYWSKEEDVENDYVLSSILSLVLNGEFNAISIKEVDLRRGEETNYSYTYDEMKRITDDPIILAIIYYDGGIFAESGYFSRNNVLTEIDDNGEVYNYTYTYNREGRPLSVTKSGITINFSYEGCN